MAHIAVSISYASVAISCGVHFTGGNPITYLRKYLPPQRILAQRITGAQTRVDVLIQGGQDPHAYEPSPKQITRLVQADLYLGIGIPFEKSWMPKLQAINPRMGIIDLSKGLLDQQAKITSKIKSKTRQQISHDTHDTHNKLEHGHDLDAHLWTSPTLMKLMAAKLLDYLVKRDPKNATMYRKRYYTFSADLDALDRDIRNIFKQKNHTHNCSFMVFHPAWGHFAATYGLTQIAIEHQNKTPGAKTLTNLLDRAKDLRIPVIFVQPQFDVRTARMLATDMGAKIVTLDPLAANYFTNLRQVAEKIAKACVL